MRPLLVNARPSARALLLVSGALLAVPTLPMTAQAKTRAHVAIVAPAGRTVSGSIPFRVRGAGRNVRRVVFEIDGRRTWTATRRPFRYQHNGRLNTRVLRNGAHVLAVRTVYANKTVGKSHKRIVVSNHAARRTPASVGPKAVGVIGPPAGGVAGPTSALFNRVTYQFSTKLTPSQEANGYQVMVLQSTNSAEVAALHAANPKLIILMYQHPWVSRSTDPNALTACTSYQGDLANHPDWFLRDQNGNPIELPGASRDDYLMDVGNLAYQQACAANAIKLAKQYGFDGVFFDGIEATLRLELPKGISVPEYPTLTSWQTAMSSLLSSLAGGLHAQGLKVFGNLCGTTVTSGLWQQWSALLDGSMEESWTDGGLGTAQQIPDWSKKLANVAWSEANDKYTLLHSYNGTQAGNTFGVASMLLASNGYASYSTSNRNYTSYEMSYPEYGTAQALGAPAGPYVRLANGVYERPYSNGIVLVNPTAKTVPAFSLGGGIYSGSNLSNVGSISMAPTTGLIMLKTG